MFKHKKFSGLFRVTGYLLNFLGSTILPRFLFWKFACCQCLWFSSSAVG